MKANCTYLAYSQTNYFSDLVIDYLDAGEKLLPFYKHEVSIAGIKKSIDARKLFPQQREVLVHELQRQYEGLPQIPTVSHNIKLLRNADTFTVTTAHQPNIFTGPLYFIYKILHTIQLAATLKKQLPEYNFIPVYYMGSEDADLDEIGNIKIDGVTYK